jgi:serine/threonine-protein kinase
LTHFFIGVAEAPAYNPCWAVMQLQPGATVAHYKILETLGRGGQATAFKAEDIRLNRPVVIKALRADLAQSEAARRRFEREACLCSALDNAHIQGVYDVGQEGDLYYIVLQYVEGPTLKQFQNGRALEIRQALRLAIQLADALAVAHASGIAHRDLKPANVIVAGGKEAKILDFGLAKNLAGAPEDSGPRPIDEPVTEVGVPYGSMGYASPEQAEGRPADHRTDVFSLGVLIYEMVTGLAPFRGRHAVEVLNAVIHQTPREVRELNPRIPPGLQRILNRAMAKDPRERYQTMAALRDELMALERRFSREAEQEPGRPAVRARAAWLLSGTLGRVLGRIRIPAREARSGPHIFLSSPTRPPSWGSEDKPTLAVLPFKNLSNDPDAAFYEFSLADGVITELAHLKSLVVRPSAYIAQYVGQQVDPRQVGAELAATLVLTGAFYKARERTRVTAQLLQAATGEIVWSDQLDIAAGDFLNVQDELAERLIDGLKLTLTAEEQQQIEKPLTGSPEAYEHYLRGRDALFRFVLRSHEESDLEAAIQEIHEAIGTDPEFAHAHAMLGRCYVLHAQGYGGAQDFTLAERSLRRALELDDTITSAQLQLIYVDLHHGDKAGARATMERLLKQAPDDPSVLFVAGMLFRLDGLYQKARRMFDRLLELNPSDVVIVKMNIARILNYEGRYEDAIRELKQALDTEPEHPLVKTFLAATFFNAGQIFEAHATIDEVLKKDPHFDGARPLLAWCLSAEGRHEDARALITERVKDVATVDYDIAFWLAAFYAMEGLVDDAIEWVRVAIQLGNENYPHYATTKKLDSLRADPRFVQILEELKRGWEARRAPAEASA